MARVLRSNSFHCTQFFTKNLTTGEALQVIYKTETLKNVITAVQNVADQHGFGPVDPTELLLSVLGIGNSVVHIPGPVFEVLESYPALGYDWEKHFLSRDRSFVRSLLEVVFCKPTFAARDVETLSLEENVVNVEFDHRLRKRKIEIHYLTGLNKNDRMCVIIEGCGTEPNFFRFGHSVLWANTRLLAPYRGMRRVRIESGVD